MRTVLFISPTGTLDNGAEQAGLSLMTYLHQEKRFHIINVVPGSGDGIVSGPQVTYKEYCQRRGIEVVFIPVIRWWWEDAPAGPLPFSKRVRASYYRDNIRRIRELIKQHAVDCLVTNTVNMPQGALAAAFEHTPHLWLIHEFPTGEFSYYRSKAGFINDFSDQVFAVAGALTQAVAQLLPSREIESFLPYSHIERSELLPAVEGKGRLVCVSRLTERKNQLELLKAYSRLNRPDYGLTFIGGWDEEYKLRVDRFIKDHRLENIEFTGSLSDPWRQVSESDIFVNTSALETFGLSYMEASANGIPCVVSDNPGFGEVYQLIHSGRMYQQGDVGALVEALRMTIDHFDESREEAASVAERVPKVYTLERAYGRFAQSLDEVCESGRELRAAIGQLTTRDYLMRHLASLSTARTSRGQLDDSLVRAAKAARVVRHRRF